MIPSSVTSIGNYAFDGCSAMSGIFFTGNAPAVGTGVFTLDSLTTVYYLPGTTGWSSPFATRQAAPWFLPYPTILNFEPNFGIHTNRFGFIISWATNIYVWVEAATNLVTPVWSPISTNTLTAGSSYFGDPQWTNYPVRFYRLRSP
jgi:hypothetical protein